VTSSELENGCICNGDKADFPESQESDSIKPGEITQPKPNNTGEVTTQEPNNSVEKSTENEREMTKTSVNKCDTGHILVPASKGFCIAVKKYIECFKEVLSEHVFNSAA
jgi:hypothetical protein